jgi:hypothetical protein
VFLWLRESCVLRVVCYGEQGRQSTTVTEEYVVKGSNVHDGAGLLEHHGGGTDRRKLGGVGMLIERFKDAPEVYVKHCHQGGSAHEDGRIHVGDRFVYSSCVFVTDY